MAAYKSKQMYKIYTRVQGTLLGDQSEPNFIVGNYKTSQFEWLLQWLVSKGTEPNRIWKQLGHENVS